MLLLSAHRSRLLLGFEISTRKAIRRTIVWVNNPFWVDACTSSDLCERPSKTPSVWKTGPPGHLRWKCVVFERKLERINFGRRLDELNMLDASEIHVRRLNVKEVLVPKQRDEFILPCADGAVKLVGRDQVPRTSTLKS